MMQPLPIRPPAVRLRHARQDHAICLRLAASYRERHARGERGMIEQHGWVVTHARTLRARFAGLSNHDVARCGDRLGEAVAALVLIVGGSVLTGIMSLF